MNILDVAAIIVLSVIVFTTGMVFSGKGKNISTFFSAGGAVPWYISGLSLFMGFFSAGTFVVWGSIAYGQGMVSISIQWMMALAGLLVGVFIAPRWNKVKIVTVASYLHKRFGTGVQKIYSYIFLCIAIFTSGAFLYPVARIINAATEWPLPACIIALGLISVVYVTAGGLWAVMITDVLQFIILFSAVVAVLVLSFDKVPSFTGFADQMPQGFTQLYNAEFSILFLIAFMFYNFIFLGGNWAYVQRYSSVKNPSDARKVGYLFGALYIVSPVLWMLPPIIYRYINPNLSGLEGESAYLLMCKEILPSGLLGLMLGGMVFATASSLNANLNILSGVFTNDIYKILFPKSSFERLMRVARLSTFAFGLLAIGVALSVQLLGGIVNVVLSIAAITGASLYLPILWSLFFRQLSGKILLGISIISLVLNGSYKLGAVPLGLAYSRTYEMLLGVAIPLVLLCVATLLYRRGVLAAGTGVASEGDENALPMPQPAPDTVAIQAGNRYGLKVLGIAICTTGVCIAVMGLFSSHHVFISGSIGLAQIVLGLFFWIKNA